MTAPTLAPELREALRAKIATKIVGNRNFTLDEVVDAALAALAPAFAAPDVLAALERAIRNAASPEPEAWEENVDWHGMALAVLDIFSPRLLAHEAALAEARAAERERILGLVESCRPRQPLRPMPATMAAAAMKCDEIAELIRALKDLA